MFAVSLEGSRECIKVGVFGEGSTFAIRLVSRGGSHGVYSSQRHRFERIRRRVYFVLSACPNNLCLSET